MSNALFVQQGGYQNFKYSNKNGSLSPPVVHFLVKATESDWPLTDTVSSETPWLPQPVGTRISRYGCQYRYRAGVVSNWSSIIQQLQWHMRPSVTVACHFLIRSPATHICNTCARGRTNLTL